MTAMALQMRNIFLKPVDRPIDGVIKADDETSLRTEVEEYVITSEIAQRLEAFLQAYNNYSTANGVWISGLFGSGKSHLLKMLAYLLENHEVEGVPAYDLFKDKKELTDNPMLAGALRKAVLIPSKSILFNIDQKADVISKNEVDALLAVFQKVFDEMCGYFGKQPHIAQFERDLDGRGVLATFKQAYAAIAGKPWERGREQALLEKANIAKAFAQVAGQAEADLADILGHYRKDHRVSIEDFANTVKAWIDQKGPKFRLNFFVDEVGQYIANNTKLMTNLQTIAESLNTRCRGQAWVLVTAQQDMASVIGDVTVQQENDFSKIQARFATRMPLSSSDVAEVIQKRLLAKTEEGTAALANLHAKEENNLKTLFDFTDGSIRLKNFNDRPHFIESYPFPPYQYTLFQMAITSLSHHNAFEGKHSSVGERSMLAVFQEVAKRLADIPVGCLATFDLMFEGIRSTLKSAIQQSIQIAEKNFDRDADERFAVRVLKALFLVKYVKEFKPTVRNIGILLLSEFDCDQGAQRRKIEEALNFLERNTLIQRNGEVFEFLTDEEVDVQNEIKGLDVDPSERDKELETLIFEETIRHRKIKHTTTGNEYAFSRKLDDRLLGKEHELSINVISPFDEDAASPDAVRMRSMTREELAVVLTPDARFIRDLSLYKKTDKFVRQARSGTHQPGRDRIVAEMGEQNARRRGDLKTHLQKLMAEARLFVRGEDVEIAGEDSQERVVKAFQILIDKVYVNLPMLRGISYGEADIGRALKGAAGLFGNDGTGLTEAETEILNHAQSQTKQGLRVTAKALVERFEAKPFGWPTSAILCVTASLIGRGKLEARSDSTVLEAADLERSLRNSNMLANILLAPQVEFSASQIKKARDLYREFFDGPSDGTDAKALGAETAAAFERLRGEIKDLLTQRAAFPFLSALTPVVETMSAATGKSAAWYITDLPKLEDALLDAKESVLDPIRSFMGGPQKAIYEDVRRFLNDEAENFSYAGEIEADALRAVLSDPQCYKGTAIQGLKARHFDLKSILDLKVIEERKAVEAEIDICKSLLEALPDIEKLSFDQRTELFAKLDRARQGLKNMPLIAVLRERANTIRSQLFPQLLSEIDRLTRPVAPPRPPLEPGAAPGLSEAPGPTPKPVAYVHVGKLAQNLGKAYLATDAEVDTYIETLRTALKSAIKAGNRIIE
jgi:hypothetical protein